MQRFQTSKPRPIARRFRGKVVRSGPETELDRNERPKDPRGASQRGQSRSWSLDEVADAEMSHMRDSFGTVEVTEFGSGFLAGIHSGNSSATSVMGCPS